jgi:molybdopterin-guanine dinucleotide biosynthesis protein A
MLGIVLAGGRSTRMGLDKSQLILGGETLLDRAIRLLQEAGLQEVMVSGVEISDETFLGHSEKIQARSRLIFDYQVIPDIHQYAGPAAAVLSILTWMNDKDRLGEQLLLIPVDMPLLKLSSLLKLREAAKNHQACRPNQAIFPCVLPSSETILDHLQDLFSKPKVVEDKRSKNSLKALFKFVNSKELSWSVTYEESLNCNTPKDFEKISIEFSKP